MKIFVDVREWVFVMYVCVCVCVCVRERERERESSQYLSYVYVCMLVVDVVSIFKLIRQNQLFLSL